MKAVCALLLCLPCVAGAQMPASESYFGVGVGNLDYELRSDDVKFFNASAATLSVYGGFWLSRRWAFEGSWQLTETSEQLGLPTDFPTIAALSVPNSATTITAAKLSIVTLRALRFMPYRWGSAFAGFGISGASVDSHIDLSDNANGRVVLANPRTSNNGLMLAAGAQWDFRRVSLRLGYEWWDDDMSAIELSIHRRL
jgi:opacity protein-like surface antigen